jgi:hypothetical protein
MADNFVSYDRDTLFLMPPSVQDWFAGKPPGKIRGRSGVATGPSADSGLVCGPRFGSLVDANYLGRSVDGIYLGRLGA